MFYLQCIIVDEQDIIKLPEFARDSEKRTRMTKLWF